MWKLKLSSDERFIYFIFTVSLGLAIFAEHSNVPLKMLTDE